MREAHPSQSGRKSLEGDLGKVKRGDCIVTLFNDPEIGCDVKVGSDTIGMGLNLCVLPFVID